MDSPEYRRVRNCGKLTADIMKFSSSKQRPKRLSSPSSNASTKGEATHRTFLALCILLHREVIVGRRYKNKSYFTLEHIRYSSQWL